MRKYISLFVALTVLSLTSCKEVPLGQIPTDGEKPSPLTNMVVENQPGGAKISYKLPEETDISYVKAEFMLNGRSSEVRTSVYNNFLKVEGFGSTNPTEITLYTVDHSENKSEPVKVTITPTTPPVQLILNSLRNRIINDFGGINITWDNVSKAEVGITLMSANHKGELEEVNTLYTSTVKGNYSFRGFPDKKTAFGIVIKDKWKNLSDTLKFEATPIFEHLLDKKKHRRVTDIPLDNLSQLGGWEFGKMFDDTFMDGLGWHTADANGGKLPLYFTIDLGVDAKLSRFKLWHRLPLAYKHQNIKTFEVFGCLSYEKGQPSTYWASPTGAWEGEWYKFGKFVTPKPSGDDGPVTSEDQNFADEGFEFKMPLESPKVRYLRIKMINNWTGGTDLHISELSFYGNDKN